MIARLGAGLLCVVATVSAWQPVRRDVSLIVTGGTVVTMDGEARVLTRGAVVVDGPDIVAVDGSEAVAARYDARERIDAGGHIVLPGLINTHTHAPMVLYRGLADDLALMEWLEKYIFPAEAKTVSPEFVRAGTRLAALEMIQSGTTTYADMYYFEEEIARATREAGLRGVLGQTIIQFPAPDAKTPSEGIARAARFLQQWASDDLIVPAIAPHAMYTLDGATLKAIRSVADRERAPVIIHLAETRDEVAIALERHKATPVQYLESLGFWGPRTIAAHGVHLTAADIRLLARRRVGIAHNPESNMKLASGAAPVLELQRAAVPVGLGTDGAASNNDLDMFEAMRQAAFLQKHVTGDPRALPARRALQMATIDGARVLGLDRQLGSLEVGKRADLLVVSTSAARQVPLYDPLSHLVYVTRGDDVRTVVVNGRVIMRDRRVSTLDEAAVLDAARSWAEKVRAAVQGQ
ncbi:MAG TPA: amidohydrolase [Vicinamibacterales bacterium]|nr:amidohydrolase [Vicinamibacterales bacterium]